MLPNFGQRTDRLPAGLRLVRELEFFEGPILSEYRATGSGSAYVEKWCAHDGGVSRFLLVRSDQRAIAEFLGGRLSMRELLNSRSDGIGLLIDRAGSVAPQEHHRMPAVWLVSIAELPRGYLPRPERLHDESFRPEWDTVPQSYLVDVDDWDAKMFAAIERNYLNATSFAYHTKPGTDRELPRNILDIRYDGGYSVMHAFNAIRERVPLAARAKPAAVAAASPGVLTIATPAETSAQLVQAVRALSSSVVAYQAVHAWSRLTMDNVEAVPGTASDTVDRLCRALNVDPRKLYAQNGASEVERRYATLVAGKLIAAYYRVLHRVVRPIHGAELMGANLDEEPDIPVVDLQEDEPELVELSPRKR